MRTFLFKFLTVLCLVVLVGSQQASAFSTNDFDCTNLGTCFYDPAACANSGSTSTGAIDAVTATGKSAWNSTAQPPYYMEELVINILQDLAQTLNVPQSDTVTQQHVIAMIAWAQAEGGNIANSNAFNVWNMGFLSSNSKLYVGGGGAGDGSSDSFVSFNAAVQAYAIELTGSYQSRIGAILSRPNSSPEQIFHAIAYPQSTSGNQIWAAADPTTYINSMEGGLNAVKQNYGQLASVVLGPGEENTHHIPTSELQFSAGSGSNDAATASSDDSGSGGGNCSCPNSSGGSSAPTDASDSTASGSGPTIVLDPGHATKANEAVDPATNEPVFDYSNPIEQQQVWDMAQDLKTKLTAAGYNVLITKSSEDDTNTNLKERAEVGNRAKAALGVSLHTTPGSRTVGNDVFNPVVGEYLVKVNGQHDVYTNSDLASTDQSDAQAMVGTLNQAESGVTFKSGGYAQIYGPITREQNGITMRGTMLVTQYFATVPWVYVEQYQDAGGGRTSKSAMQDYETGVLNGIKKIVPPTTTTSGNDNSATDSASSGCPNTSSSADCSSAAGDTKILCQAKQYLGIYYEWGGGHQGAKAYDAACPDPSNPPDNKPTGGPVNGDPAGLSGNPSPCALDCSGLVSIAVDNALGVSDFWTVSPKGIMLGSDGTDDQNWKSIPIAQAQPGDIVTVKDATGHVEIVDQVSNGTVSTVGTRATGTKASEISKPTTYWTGGAWHWAGSGGNGN
jgi:N-acetylmuramoyl-L-alanine amidase